MASKMARVLAQGIASYLPQAPVYASFTTPLQWRTMVLVPPLPAEEGAWGLQEIQPWRGRALGPHMLLG